MNHNCRQVTFLREHFEFFELFFSCFQKRKRIIDITPMRSVVLHEERIVFFSADGVKQW